MTCAAPARSISWALRNWWLSVDAPKGMKMAARPAAAISAAVMAPGAADDQIGLGKSLRHVSDEGQNLRVDFTSSIGHSHSIIVAFAGLVHDGDAIFVRRQ